MKEHSLIVVAGPTAVGKTALSIKLARDLNTEILSADSRQFYKEMSIGTAKPTDDEMQGIVHHFINCRSVTEKSPYNASTFEEEALSLLAQLFTHHRSVILTGGSGLYINALCEGFDENIPSADPVIRKELDRLFSEKGIFGLQEQLESLDPDYFMQVDVNNPKRLMRAIEVCRITGQPYSAIRKGKKRERPFSIIKIGLEMEREELFERINQRVDEMILAGLEAEVKQLLPYYDRNALKTVGYQEMQAYLTGSMGFDDAVEKIKVNSRRYAKRQLTWFKKDPAYHWFHPEQYADIIDFIRSKQQQNSYF